MFVNSKCKMMKLKERRFSLYRYKAFDSFSLTYNVSNESKDHPARKGI